MAGVESWLQWLLRTLQNIGTGRRGMTRDDIDELTIGWSNISVPFGSADLDQCGEYVVNALGEVVRGVKNQTRDKGSFLGDPHVEVREIVLMNERISTSWGAEPRNLPIIRLLEQVDDDRSRSSVEQGGSDDNSVQGLAGNHDLLVLCSPCNEWDVVVGGGRVGDDFISIIAVNPRS